MPDIQMRFDKDMLVLSAPLRSVLARQGVDVDRDLEYMLLVEPEALRDTVRMEKIAGAQCLVAATEGIAPARLAHKGMEERGTELALAALGMLRPLKPQHLLAEIGPCGLPARAPTPSTRTAPSTRAPPMRSTGRCSTRCSSPGSSAPTT